MKKIISTLAALSVICGSFCAAMPVTAADNIVLGADIEEAAESDHNIVNGYDLDGWHSSFTADGMTYTVYNDFALLTRVAETDAEEFTVPETYKDTPVVGLTDGPFQNCKNLKKINLTKNIAIFNWIEVAEEGIAEVTVPEDNKFFTSVDGIIYSKDKKDLVCCPTACGKTEVTVADETVSIKPGAFVCCRDLKKLTMNDKLEDIYNSVFWGCSGLTDVKFSKSLKRIGYLAFAGCSSLKEADLPDSLEEVYDDVFMDAACVKTIDGIHYVDDWAVGSDKDIETGDIKSGTVGTASGIFTGRYKLRRIYVPSSVKHITKYLLFGLGKNLNIDFVEFNNDTIPAACLGTNGIKSIYITDPNCKIEDAANALPPYWVQRDDSYVPKEEDDKTIEYTLERTKVTTSSSGSHNQSVAINTELYELVEDESGNITWVPVNGNGDSSADSGDKQASASEKIQKYMDEAKERAQQKRENEDTSGVAVAQPVEGKIYSAPIKVGATTKYDTVILGIKGSTAEDYAVKYRRVFEPFDLRPDLKDPEIVKGSENTVNYFKYMDTYATASVKINNGDTIKEITIASEADGAPVKEISVPLANADKINIPATVMRYVQQENSAEDKVAYYNVDKDNPYLTSVDGIIYSKDMTKLIKVPSRYAGKKIVVPDGVKVIDSYAFFSLDNVESIELPDSVEIIEKGSFTGCEKLSSIKLSKNLDVIGDIAFMHCTKLSDITIPDSVNHIGENAFLDVPAVETVDGLGYLGNWFVGFTPEGLSYMSKTLAPKEGTVGIAKTSTNISIVIPKSVTKMSWEMISFGGSNCTRADVYSHVIDFDAFKNAKYMKDIYIYDPECEICAGDQTIPAKHIEVTGIKGLQEVSSDAYYRTLKQELEASSGEVLADTVIHGYKDSTAEAYAKMYGIKFEEIDPSVVYKSGDLNGDGAVNVADLVMMSRFIKGMDSLDEKQTKAADLNGDGNVDIFDMVEFRKKILALMAEE